MDSELKQKIDEIVTLIRRTSGEGTTSFTLHVNAEGSHVETSERSGVDLKRIGTSMRNLRGEWIK